MREPATQYGSSAFIKSSLVPNRLIPDARTSDLENTLISSFVVDRDCPEHNQSLDRTLIIMDYNLFTTWVFLLFTKRSWRLSCSRGSSLRWGGSRTLNPPTCTGGAQCESSKRFLSPDYWVMFLNVCDLRDTSSIYIWILYIASNLGT